MRKIYLIIVLVFIFSLIPTSLAHQDGCHSKHSCPSDSGSYICGDTGNCSECPENQYCKADKYNPSSDSPSLDNEVRCTSGTACFLEGDFLQYSEERAFKYDMWSDWRNGTNNYFVKYGGSYDQYRSMVNIAGSYKEWNHQSGISGETLAGGTVCCYKFMYLLPSPVDINRWILSTSADYWKDNVSEGFYNYHGIKRTAIFVNDHGIKQVYDKDTGILLFLDYDFKGRGFEKYTLIDTNIISEKIQTSTIDPILPKTTTIEPSQSKTNVPTWVKNNAKWWTEGQIKDSEFLKGVEYLVKENIIKVKHTASEKKSSDIPSWIKNNAKWWSQGLITEDDFLKGIQFLASNGIIQVNSNQNCIGNKICDTESVTKIVDGDTLYTKSYQIRLSLTNTPEKGEDGFSEATQFTANLCPVGSSIMIDQDDLQPYDKYDRLVGKVFCGEKILNSELLYNNHANILTSYCKTSEFSGETWATEFGCYNVQNVPEIQKIDPEPKTVSVEIPKGTFSPGCEVSNACYLPASVTINAGDTVEWKNVDTAAHTVTGGSQANGLSGGFDSSLIMGGASFTHTFDDAGSYDYYCMVHPWMNGLVIVQ